MNLNKERGKLLRRQKLVPKMLSKSLASPKFRFCHSPISMQGRSSLRSTANTRETFSIRGTLYENEGIDDALRGALIVYLESHKRSVHEFSTRQKEIVAQADLPGKSASGSLQAIMRDQLAIENVFAKLRELGTRAPDALVSGIAHALTVFDRYPLAEEEDVITEDGNDFVLHYKGNEGRFPKIPFFAHKWTCPRNRNSQPCFADP